MIKHVIYCLDCRQAWADEDEECACTCTGPGLETWIAEPAAAQCSANAPVTAGGRTGFACWYPSMGGYAAKAIVLHEDDDCTEETHGDCGIDVAIWHNGDFPFSGEFTDVPSNPVVLHHCSAADFIHFGELVARLLGGEP